MDLQCPSLGSRAVPQWQATALLYFNFPGLTMPQHLEISTLKIDHARYSCEGLLSASYFETVSRRSSANKSLFGLQVASFR